MSGSAPVDREAQRPQRASHRHHRPLDAFGGAIQLNAVEPTDYVDAPTCPRSPDRAA